MKNVSQKIKINLKHVFHHNSFQLNINDTMHFIIYYASIICDGKHDFPIYRRKYVYFLFRYSNRTIIHSTFQRNIHFFTHTYTDEYRQDVQTNIYVHVTYSNGTFILIYTETIFVHKDTLTHTVGLSTLNVIQDFKIFQCNFQSYESVNECE